MKPSRIIEPLEARIAPAVFFLSGAELAITDAAGNDMSDAGKAAQAGVSHAMVMRSGDALYMDFDGDRVVDGFHAAAPADPIDFKLIALSGGAAVVFFDDVDGDGNFEPEEIRGLAAGDILAGKSISNVKIGGGLYSTGPSAFAIAAGSSAHNHSVNYRGGADLNGNDVFNFLNNVPPVTFNTGDTAIDGLVLVRAAGLAPLPVTPLLLLAV